MVVRKVGTARIVREVGRGGMGVVYEAEQEGLQRRVAIKELPAEFAVKPDFVERFRREGLAYAQLRHQAIVTVHDLVEKNDSLFLITEFVQGADLARLLERGGGLPADVVAIVGARVAEALDHVHLHRLVHRDIKPSNIMVDVEGAVKLMDFGIAKDQTADGLTRDGLVVGSPPYMAPEALAGEKPNAGGDIWALGVTLYELCTGERPFRGKDTGELFANIRRGSFPSVRKKAPEVPRALARAIELCLKHSPRARWQTAAAMARELDGIATRLLRGTHPQVRLMQVMLERGLVQQQELTLIDAGSLVIDSKGVSSISVEVEERFTPRRWPYVLVALAAAAGVGYTQFGGARLLELLR